MEVAGRLTRALATSTFVVLLAGCLTTIPDYPPLVDVEPKSAESRVIKATYIRTFLEWYRLSLSDEERVALVREEARTLFERFCDDAPIIHQRQEVIGVSGTAKVQSYRHFVQLECAFDSQAADEARASGSLAGLMLWGRTNTPRTESGEYFGFYFNNKNSAMKLDIATRAEDHSFWDINREERYFTEDLLSSPPWE